MDSYTLPDELRYTASHLWVGGDADLVTIGLTEHGQERYGKILYVGLPAVGSPVSFGMPVGYLQSAGYGLTQVFPPIQGEVAEINDALWVRPSLVNEDPLGDGWLLRISGSNKSELAELESASEYRAILSGERRLHAAELPSHLMEAAEPVFLIDERRRVLSCNHAAEALIGLSQREMRHGPLCSELFGCHTEDDQSIGKSSCPGLCSMLNLEVVEGAEYVVTNAQGGETKVRATYRPLAEPGQPRRAVVQLDRLD